MDSYDGFVVVEGHRSGEGFGLGRITCSFGAAGIIADNSFRYSSLTFTLTSYQQLFHSRNGSPW